GVGDRHVTGSPRRAGFGARGRRVARTGLEQHEPDLAGPGDVGRGPRGHEALPLGHDPDEPVRTLARGRAGAERAVLSGDGAADDAVGTAGDLLDEGHADAGDAGPGDAGVVLARNGDGADPAAGDV